eukprot:CAMPEP_0170178560 /NCGR_PEP_ID=MMETSP0040_2-20121228/12042_1 /TAXON_ID=641309 /ORGANISM="Lotharella oceanica, Strain CCMP622" /LENGTH=158 /DNA_ID=CAMNT_0010421669 /DNA_START=83 /DNA_END=559 /DNA_ORIENTATION=-
MPRSLPVLRAQRQAATYDYTVVCKNVTHDALPVGTSEQAVLEGDRRKDYTDRSGRPKEDIAGHLHGFDVKSLQGVVPNQVPDAAEVVECERESNAKLGNWDNSGCGSFHCVQDDRNIAINCHCSSSNTKAPYGEEAPGHTVRDGGERSNRKLIDVHVG